MNKPVVVYDASNSDRLSVSAWPHMVREFRDSRELIRRLVQRNFSAQFRQSFLGYLWVVLPPVATTLVFALLRQAEIVNVPMGEGRMPYVLFALLGTTIWGFFTQLTMMATGSIANAGSLVSKVYFPREVLVVSAAGNAVINFIIRLGVVALTLLFVRYLPHPAALLVPVALLPMVALALGLGLFFAPINTMMSDMGRLLEFAFQFGLFLAPTVYPTPPAPWVHDGGTWSTAIYWLHMLNPVSHFLYAAHSLIEHGTLLLTPGYLISSLFSLLVLLMGWRFFHVCEPLLAERL
ncbi:MAG: ABC transporter permease [Kiritimatiellae bacterium]|nr:ABC transporter permease [Kiritimatiellia bacterium]